MPSEKEFITICKALIEKKIHFPPKELWKQRDFEYLSDLLFEKTGTRISISTLKRIWKDTESGTPQLYTLNALARFSDFQSWSDFKQQHSNQHVPDETKPADIREASKVSAPIYILSISLVLMGLALAIYFTVTRKTYSVNDVVFKSRKSLSSGVPNTVVFEYDISKINFDSAFIQHSWDKRLRARINKDNHFQTFIYYYPGYHTAKLIINDTVLKTEHINISTSGWQAMVDGTSADGLPQYISGNDIFSDHQLYVSKKTLNENHIPVDNKNFWLNYFNVGILKEAAGENFTLETRLKNSLEDGALTCQYCQLTIICEQGMISIPFSNPGCVANNNLHISEVFKNGRKNDLSAFGIDLSVWRSIKLKTIKKQVEVYVDDKKIFYLPFQQDLGRINGFHYKFYGCGAVNLLRLYDGKGELCFADDFNGKL